MKIVESFRYGPIRAECVKYSAGGDPIVAIESDTATGEDAEVVLDVLETKALHAWLGTVLAALGEPDAR